MTSVVAVIFVAGESDVVAEDRRRNVLVLI